MSARQQRMALGTCSHEVLEDVKTYGGEVIAHQCKGCTAVVTAIGKCDGCGKTRPIRKHVASRNKNYCTGDCYQQALKRSRGAVR